jgi:pimeloyl-ACP methyl ester carboxylesterase
MVKTEETVRKYGTPPFEVAVLHGGPGAQGYMAPVARELSQKTGVLEPIQTKDSVDGQIEELKYQLMEHADIPVTLIGSSWGAVLALFLASRYPELTKKLILVGSAVFDAQSSARIEKIRTERLNEKARKRLNEIETRLLTAVPDEKEELFEELGGVFTATDEYDPIDADDETIEVQYEIFRKVWPEFMELRDRPGYLKKEFFKINIPVTVIHGDYDPHPLEGIKPFLEDCISNLSFYILSECGHYPWLERHARDRFFEILSAELAE